MASSLHGQGRGNNFHLEWAKDLVTKSSPTGRRGGAQPYDPIWNEPNGHRLPEASRNYAANINYPREDHNGYDQNHSGIRNERDYHDQREDNFRKNGYGQERREVLHRGYVNRGGQRSSYPNYRDRFDHTKQDWRERSHQNRHSDPPRSYRPRPYVRPTSTSTTTTSFPKRRSSREFRSRSPRRNQSFDDSDSDDYELNDLIQFMRERQRDGTHTPEHQSSRPSHDQDDKNTSRSNSRHSGWDIKLSATDDDSKSKITSNAQSDSEHETLKISCANEPTNHDNSLPSSNLDQSLDTLPPPTNRDNVENLIQSSDSLSTNTIPQSDNIELTPIVSESSYVLLPSGLDMMDTSVASIVADNISSNSTFLRSANIESTGSLANSTNVFSSSTSKRILNESSNNISCPQATIESQNPSTGSASPENTSLNNSPPASKIIELIDLTESPDSPDSPECLESPESPINLTRKVNDEPTTNASPTRQESNNSIVTSQTGTHNIQVPANHKPNRKRSIDMSTAVNPSDQRSQRSSDTRQTDMNEVPAKQSKHHATVPKTTNREDVRNKESAAPAQYVKERNNNVTTDAYKPTILSSNGNNVNELRDPVNPKVIASSIPKDAHKKPVEFVDNVNTSILSTLAPIQNQYQSNEPIHTVHPKVIATCRSQGVSRNVDTKVEKENKEDLDCKNSDKKLKKLIKGRNVDENKDTKPNIVKKNRVEQFKYILKILKVRSNGWTLAQLEELKADNICDAIYHFEKTDKDICAFMEVKFLENSNKMSKINYRNLFGEEFNIQRYFATFFKFERSCFTSQQSKLVILTNAEIDRSLLQNNGVQVSRNNDCYTFKIEQPYEDSKIFKKCLECFVLPKLAGLLIEYIRKSDKLPHFNVDLLRKYHWALVNDKVLQMKDEKKNGKYIRIAKFHPNFIQGEGLSDAAMELRYHFERCNTLPTDNMKFRVGNKDFGENIASAKFAETVDNLPNENCKQTFAHFFEAFEIVKVTKLSDEVVVRELGEIFLKIDEDVYLKAVQEELLISLNDKGLHPDILKSLHYKISKLKVIERISERKIPPIDLQFEPATLLNLAGKITSKEVIICSTESLLLSDLKMRQISKELGYLENLESLFITDNILFQMTDDVVNAFSHRTTNLLVITWENNLEIDVNYTQEIEKVIKRLRDVASNSSKKVVIIANKENVNISHSRYEIPRIDEDLKFQAQNDCIKSAKVILQERMFHLSDIADDAAIKDLIESSIILEKLLTGKVKIGSELVKPAGFQEKLYEFKLNQRVIINSNIFQEKIKDIFLIRNISIQNFYLQYKPSDKVIYLSDPQSHSIELPLNVKFILLDDKVNPSAIFKRLKGKNVHLLEYESSHFIWKSTRGSLVALLKFRIADDNLPCTSNSIDEIMINGPKTVIISGESGMGKSACLYDFVKLATGAFDPLWLIQVDLNQPLKITLKGYPIETYDNAIHFLADYLEFKDEQKELFIMSTQGRLKMKMMLFIDGYDDLQENVDLMTKLLQHLQDCKVVNIFIASNTKKLENTLRTFSYSLYFPNEDKLQLAEKINGSKVFQSDSSERSRLLKLLNTPLHMKMYIEICRKKTKNIVDIYDLYKNYVSLFLSSSDLTNAYEFSARKLLSEEEFRETDAKIENVNLELPDELSRKTVIEYFTAKWLSKRQSDVKKCIDRLIEDTSSVFLKTYLIAYKVEKKDKISVNDYAEGGYLNSLNAILKLDCTNKPCLNGLIRKGRNKTFKILQCLLEHYNDTGCSGFIEPATYKNSSLVKYVNQRVDHQTPLQTSAKYQKVDLACELMLNGADISVLYENPDFITKMAKYATKQLANGDTRLGPAAAKLLEKSPQIFTHFDNRTQLPIILSYLFSHGYADLIVQLLKGRHAQERCKILETAVNGKSFLDQVNENQCIKDEDRRKLISYLVTNNNPNLLKNNIDSILKFACRYGHEQTFNYFIHLPKEIIDPPKTAIDILHEALRNNDEKIIEFLMRDSERTKDANGNNALHQAITLGVSRKTINYLLGKVGINDTNNSGETVLHLAFRHAADLSTIKFLINAGASLTVKNRLSFYPWILALKEESSRYSKEQQRELMTYLIKDKNIQFLEGESKNYEFDMTKTVVLPKLEYFANADNYNIDYHNDVSRLHDALTKQDKKNWCMFLIHHGADVNVQNKNGESAFHVAVDNGHYEVAKLMLQHGAIFDKTDKRKDTPLDCLKYKVNNGKSYEEMKEILTLATKIFQNNREYEKKFETIILSVNSANIDKSPIRYLLNCRNKHDETLLHVAARLGNAAVISHLHKLSKEYQLRYKDDPPLDVNAVDNCGNTPIHLAAAKNSESVAKLLSIGARFQMENYAKERPIDLARQDPSIAKLLQAAKDLFDFIGNHNVEEIRKLLKKHPEVQNARDNSGKSPLHLAKSDILKYILYYKYVEVNALDEHHRPPIYYAANENDLNKTILLLKAGANYDFQGFRNGSNNAFKLLQKINEMFEDVQSHKPKFFVDTNPWALESELDKIEKTFGIARDIIVNVKDSQRNSLLHYSAKYDYVDVAKNLLRNGAIHNSRNLYGKTPSDLAINSKLLFESVSNLFINLDVNTWTDVDTMIAVNCRMSGGFTLLHKAIEAQKRETVEWLVDRGADVNATTNNSTRMRMDNYPEIKKLLSTKKK